MYVCMCNPFTDSDVQAHLERGEAQKQCVKDVYRACSDGEAMNCCSCAPMLKEMVDTHNNGLTIKSLSQKMVHLKNRAQEAV